MLRDDVALPEPDAPAEALDLQIPADFLSVREACEQVALRLAATGTKAESTSRISIVLAEALNNVVEHGGLGKGDPGIELRVTLSCSCHLRIRDRGKPVPDALISCAARGQMPHSAERALLPEGGFGWPLIRMLSDRLDYASSGGWNRLDIEIAV